jgi:hypothetical protein
MYYGFRKFFLLFIFCIFINTSLFAQQTDFCEPIAETMAILSVEENSYKFSPWTFENPPENLKLEAFLPAAYIERFSARFPEKKLKVIVEDSVHTYLGEKHKSISIRISDETASGDGVDYLRFELTPAPWNKSGVLFDSFEMKDPTNETAKLKRGTQVEKGLSFKEFKYATTGMKNLLQAGGATSVYTLGPSEYLTYKLYQRVFKFRPWGAIPFQTYSMIEELYKYSRHKLMDEDRIGSVQEFSTRLGRTWGLVDKNVKNPVLSPYTSRDRALLNEALRSSKVPDTRVYRDPVTKFIIAISVAENEGRRVLLVDRSVNPPVLLEWNNLLLQNRLYLEADLKSDQPQLNQ